MAIRFEEPHGPRRAAEYPAIGDQLDAIWKALAALDPETLPPEARAMLDQVQAVKKKYPVREGKASN